jgi:hypothetical protein
MLKVRRDKVDNRQRWLCQNAKARAKKYDVPYDLKPSDVKIPSICPVIGIPLSPGINQLHDGSPTLDRIVPNMGYVPGNVAVISHKANRMKNNNGTLEELKAVVRWMEAMINGS